MELWALFRIKPSTSTASRSVSVKLSSIASGFEIAFKKAESRRLRRTTNREATAVGHLKIIQSSRFRMENSSFSPSGRILSDVPQSSRRGRGDARCVVCDKVKKCEPLFINRKK